MYQRPLSSCHGATTCGKIDARQEGVAQESAKRATKNQKK